MPIPGFTINHRPYAFLRSWDPEAVAERAALKTMRRAGMVAAIICGLLAWIGSGLWWTGDLSTATAPLDTLFTPHPAWALAGFGLLLLSYGWYFSVRAKDEEVSLPRPYSVEDASVDGAHAHDLAALFAPELSRALDEAVRLQKEMRHQSVAPLHFFAGTLSTTTGKIFLARLGVSFADIKSPLQRYLLPLPQGESHFGDYAQTFMLRVIKIALERGQSTVRVADLLDALMREEEFLRNLFAERGANENDLTNVVTWLRVSADLRDRSAAFQEAAAFKPTGSMDRAMTAMRSHFLEATSTDLTRAAVYGRTGLLIGRAEEMSSILRAFEGGKRAVVLVGEPGVGRGALLEGMADAMVEEHVPNILKDKRLLVLDVARIVSAEGGQGAAERFLYALSEMRRAGNIVVCVKNLHDLAIQGAGMDLLSILAGELDRPGTLLIGTTTPAGFTNSLERSALMTKIARVDVREPARDHAIQILEAKCGLIEGRQGIFFTYGALAACVDLAIRYIADGVLPQKSLALAEEVAVFAKGQGKEWITRDDVAALVTQKTRIPVTDVKTDEKDKLLHFAERLHERVIGQDLAVEAVASALKRARTALRSENRPIASFLFMGPTGVGKTELAKTTAELYFGSEKSMTRFDMSEYQTAESAARLIGGNGEAGLLTEAVRRNPFTLLLLDELEKADKEVLNLFLQVMDDGRLTDGLGRTIDFTNVIIIATSNAGTTYIQDEIKKKTDLAAIKTALLETELRGIYAPEFLNRFTDVIVFSPLTEADVVAIAYLMIDKVIKRIEEKGMTLVVTDAAVHELAKLGYDPMFGARPLRRVLEDKVENALADLLLKDDVKRRDTITLDAGGKLTVSHAASL